LLFAHWRVPLESIQRLIPPELRLDTYQDAAWVSAVAFDLETRRIGVTLRFPELNLRTYVRMNNTPGVFFLSLHAGHRLGVALARRLTPLPYFHAPIQVARTPSAFAFASPLFRADCRLGDRDFEPQPSSLDEWLLERYAGFCRDRSGGLFQVAVSHPRWRIRGEEFRLRAATLGRLSGIDLEREPDVWHFSDGVAARVSGFRNVLACNDLRSSNL
jgi:uncharacterized protein YqjF (DUF2071 family)